MQENLRNDRVSSQVPRELLYFQVTLWRVLTVAKKLAGKGDACTVFVFPDLNFDIRKSYEYSDYYDDRICKISIFLL